MKCVQCVVMFFALCVPTVASAQWTPDPGTAVWIAATDAWFASLNVDPTYTAVEGFKAFLDTANVSAIALEIAGNPNTTIGEIDDADDWEADFYAEKDLGDTDFGVAVAKRTLAKLNWNEGWNAALQGTSAGNATAVLKFAACYTNATASIAKFESAQDHYNLCFLDYTSLVMLRDDVRNRVGALIP